MKKVVIILVVVIPFILLCCCCGSLYWGSIAFNNSVATSNDLSFQEIKEDNYEYNDYDEQTSDSKDDIDINVDKLDQAGVISGNLSYPSEFLPLLKVCALNLEENITICTQEILDSYTSPSGYMYELEVKPGSYNVYAVELDQNGNEVTGYKAYYSEFVTCGLRVDCNSHEPIVVEVTSGDNLGEIDPGDWYNNQ